MTGSDFSLSQEKRPQKSRAFKLRLNPRQAFWIALLFAIGVGFAITDVGERLHAGQPGLTPDGMKSASFRLEHPRFEAKASMLAASDDAKLVRKCPENSGCNKVREIILSRTGVENAQRIACVEFDPENDFCWKAIVQQALDVVDTARQVKMANKFFFALQTYLPKGAKGSAVMGIGDSGEKLSDDVMHRLMDNKTPYLGHAMLASSEPRPFVFAPDYQFMASNAFAITRKSVTRVAVPFEQRKPGVFWRGSTTGLTSRHCSPEERVRNSTCTTSHQCFTKPRVALSILSQNIEFADVMLSKSPHSCCEACEGLLRKMGILSEFVKPEDWVKYRAILDIDGNSSAWGLYWRLTSGSVVLRVESQWTGQYMRKMKPWVHYVPVRNDFADFEERVSLASSEKPADVAMLKKIAENAAALAASNDFEAEVRRLSAELSYVWGGKRKVA